MPTLTRGNAGGGDQSNPLAIDDFDGFLTAATLLRNSRLARSYVYICYYGPTTVQELVEALDVARATAYDDVEQLESRRLLVRDERTRPHTLSAEPFAFVDADDVAITPTVLHAVALTDVDEDLDYFESRYGTARLVRALRLAGEHYAGNLTQRMAADELDVTPVEAMAVILALRPALAAGREFDPYFDRLFPEIAGDVDVDVDVRSPGPSRETDDDEFRII